MQNKQNGRTAPPHDDGGAQILATSRQAHNNNGSSAIVGHQPLGVQPVHTHPQGLKVSPEDWDGIFNKLDWLEEERRAALELASRLKLDSRLPLLKLADSLSDGLSWGEVQDGELFIVFWQGTPVFRVFKGRVVTFRRGGWLELALEAASKMVLQALVDLEANWKPLSDSDSLPAEDGQQTQGFVTSTGTMLSLRPIRREVDNEAAQKRFKNARDVSVEIIASTDNLVEARTNNCYLTVVSTDMTAGSCECRDWVFNLSGTWTPCKHIYALAISENLPK